MGLIKEFKEFAMRGNVIDMAVGIVIGAAFGKIVTSIVSDVVMPPLGVVTGNVDFKDKMYVLTQKADAITGKMVPDAAIRYGVFINTVIDFIIVALAIFVVIKLMNAAKRKPPEAPPGPPTTKECPLCLSTIPIKAVRCAHCAADLPATAA